MAKNPIDPIAVIDDEEHIRKSYIEALASSGFNNVIECSDARAVMDTLASTRVSAMLLDLMMPYMTGEELLARIHEEHPSIPVIIVTGSVRVQTIVECLKKGAFDYLLKPVDETRLATCVRHALHVSRLNNEVNILNQSFLSEDLRNPEAFTSIVTQSGRMSHIFRYIEAISESQMPVLITGESGTGKELIARAIHSTSGRTGDFVAVNIAGLDDTMLSDALFGHIKGAFTGALEARKGLIEQARKGTLFLDEIGDLAQGSQVKLLRLIQENEYFMLGSDTVREADARLVFATNADLRAKKESQQFRKDLYYRLVTHQIELPPLRERREDIAILAEHFALKAALALGKQKHPVPEKILSLLYNYPFPGNVRELESIIYNAVSAGEDGEISTSEVCDHVSAHLAPEEEKIDTLQPDENRVLSFNTSLGRLPTVKEAEDFLIEEALRKTNGNMSLAARMIGLSPATMTRRVKEKHR